MKQTNWRIQFEKRQSVREQNSFLDYGDDDCPPEVNWEQIESFISHTIEQVLEDVEKQRKIEEEDQRYPHLASHDRGYNEAIDDITSSLRTKYLG